MHWAAFSKLTTRADMGTCLTSVLHTRLCGRSVICWNLSWSFMVMNNVVFIKSFLIFIRLFNVEFILRFLAYCLWRQIWGSLIFLWSIYFNRWCLFLFISRYPDFNYFRHAIIFIISVFFILHLILLSCVDCWTLWLIFINNCFYIR